MCMNLMYLLTNLKMGELKQCVRYIHSMGHGRCHLLYA